MCFFLNLFYRRKTRWFWKGTRVFCWHRQAGKSCFCLKGFKFIGHFFNVASQRFFIPGTSTKYHVATCFPGMLINILWIDGYMERGLNRTISNEGYTVGPYTSYKWGEITRMNGLIKGNWVYNPTYRGYFTPFIPGRGPPCQYLVS